jgi:uncharacterized membrane protein
MNLIKKAVIGILLLLYFFFGIIHSRHQGFWHDEIYTLTFLKGLSVYDFEGSLWSEVDTVFDVKYCQDLFSEDLFFSNFSTQIIHEGHPPLYFVLLKIWSYCLGSNEVGLRTFSLCCGILILLILFKLFRQKSKKLHTPWMLLAMLIFNPFLFYFFTEARMYALALLFATLSFYFWINYRETKKIRSYTFLYFCLSSVGLLYTHYYGIFFLSSLALFEVLKYGIKRTILNHSIAFVCFLPWGFVIKKQLTFHDVHWTDGIISFGDSIIGYFNGISNLLISPMAKSSLYEQIIIFALILLAFSLLFAKDWKFPTLMLSVILGYGLQIYIFDQLIDHHSILVPRYFLFVLIFIYWVLFKFIETTNKILSISLTTIYCIISLTVLVQIYKLDRAPKQMFREVAGFIDGQIDSNSKVLVFEPKGPLTIGVAYYLRNNFKITTADKVPKELGASAIYIDEMLGVAYRENQFHNEQQKKLELIPFVGVFLFK